MAKEIYTGIDNIAHRVTKMYIGVDNVARNVVKAYIGVDNVARQFFDNGKIHFKGHRTTYGNTVTSKDGDSLYISASGATTGDIHIDAYYELVDGGGSRYAIPAGSTITFSIRSDIYSVYNCLTCIRLEDINGNLTYPYKNSTLTNMKLTIDKDSYLIFLCEVSYSDDLDYAKMWIDKFEINGEKII